MSHDGAVSKERVAAMLKMMECQQCDGSGWHHGAQNWTQDRMRKGTPYKSVRCDCAKEYDAMKGNNR